MASRSGSSPGASSAIFSSWRVTAFSPSLIALSRCSSSARMLFISAFCASVALSWWNQGSETGPPHVFGESRRGLGELHLQLAVAARSRLAGLLELVDSRLEQSGCQAERGQKHTLDHLLIRPIGRLSARELALEVGLDRLEVFVMLLGDAIAGPRQVDIEHGELMALAWRDGQHAPSSRWCGAR